jgi:hypothetical protein
MLLTASGSEDDDTPVRAAFQAPTRSKAKDKLCSQNRAASMPPTPGENVRLSVKLVVLLGPEGEGVGTVVGATVVVVFDGEAVVDDGAMVVVAGALVVVGALVDIGATVVVGDLVVIIGEGEIHVMFTIWRLQLHSSTPFGRGQAKRLDLDS